MTLLPVEDSTGNACGVAPSADTVIAQFAVDPNLAGMEPLRLRGFQAIAELLS